MKIKKILSRSRRDFTALYVCEFCGYEEEGCGYDDRNFHENVIPDMKCEKCKQKNHLDYLSVATKYPDDLIV